MYVYLVWRNSTQWTPWFSDSQKILEGIFSTRQGAKEFIGKKNNRTIGKRKVKS